MDRLTRNIFLVDGVGAVVSTVLMATIWLRQQSWVGVPATTLMLLAAVGAVFAIYSLSCWRLSAPLMPWLPIVMAANLAYCALTLTLLLRHADVVTGFGVAYFVAEIAVLIGVVALERAVVRRGITAALQ